MKKKGFTLIELLGVLVLLSVILLIIVPPITKSIKSGQDDALERQKDNIVLSARNWSADNKTELPTSGEIKSVTLKELQEGGYAEKNIKNPKTNEELDPDTVCVDIENKNNIYYYNYNEQCAFGEAYTVTYDGNLGTVSGETTLRQYANKNVDLSIRATRNGWIFVGWSTDKNEKEALSEYKMPNKNITLYAIFKKAVVVSYNAEDSLTISKKAA